MPCSFYAQPGDGGIGAEANNFFIYGEQGQDVINSFFYSKLGILKGILCLCVEAGVKDKTAKVKY